MASILDMYATPDYLSPTYTARAGLSDAGVPSEFGISNDLSWFYKLGNSTLDEQSGGSFSPSAANPTRTAVNTMDNIGGFFTDVVSAFSGIYGAKAAVDISRIKSQTAIDITKTQGIVPKAGANLYDSAPMTNLIVFGAVGLGVWLLVRR